MVEEKSWRCRALIRACLPVLSDADAAAVKLASRVQCTALTKAGGRRHTAQDPVVRLPGPQREQAELYGIDHVTLLHGQSKTMRAIWA